MIFYQGNNRGKNRDHQYHYKSIFIQGYGYVASGIYKRGNNYCAPGGYNRGGFYDIKGPLYKQFKPE